MLVKLVVINMFTLMKPQTNPLKQTYLENKAIADKAKSFYYIPFQSSDLGIFRSECLGNRRVYERYPVPNCGWS